MSILENKVISENGKFIKVNMNYIVGLLITIVLGLTTWGLIKIVNVSECLADKVEQKELNALRAEIDNKINIIHKDIKTDIRDMRSEIRDELIDVKKDMKELSRLLGRWSPSYEIIE